MSFLGDRAAWGWPGNEREKQPGLHTFRLTEAGASAKRTRSMSGKLTGTAPRPGVAATGWWLLSVLLVMGLPAAAQAATAKRVLIVHSFGNAAPPFTTHSTAFERELTEKLGEKVDLDEVSLDVARYATLDMEEALVDLMRERRVLLTYLAEEVDFEDSLRQALGEGDATRAIVSHTHSLAATRLNGNNVNVDFELLASSENVLRQKLVVQAINNKYQLLRTAIGSAQ